MWTLIFYWLCVCKNSFMINWTRHLKVLISLFFFFFFSSVQIGGTASDTVSSIRVRVWILLAESTRQVWRWRSIVVILDLVDNMATQTLFWAEAEIFALKHLFVTVFAYEFAIWEYWLITGQLYWYVSYGIFLDDALYFICIFYFKNF